MRFSVLTLKFTRFQYCQKVNVQKVIVNVETRLFCSLILVFHLYLFVCICMCFIATRQILGFYISVVHSVQTKRPKRYHLDNQHMRIETRTQVYKDNVSNVFVLLDRVPPTISSVFSQSTLKMKD
jgi:hypothetical protein